MTSPRRISRTVGAAVAAAALVALTACGGETPQVPNLPDNLPQVPGVGDPRQAFGDAHQKALGLAALGGIGLEQGVGNTVKELAPQVQGEGQQLNDKLRGLASAIGVSLPDQVSPEIQAQVDDLKARTGEQFDQGWLQAAQAQVGALSDQTQQLLNVPGLPPEQLDQARAQLTNLGELKTKLDQAAAEAGATTPGSGSGNADGNGSGADGNAAGNGTAPGNGSGNGAGDGPASGSGSPAVDAGTGGQAASASDVALPVALGGAGLLLLVAGAVRLRRARA
ncbi:hypothetical protein Ae406Ps2_2688c [Pseudonocardia sp. Ae406_Ps2]|nr:hypothetical protein Ae331Ps2_3238 [Pseudonocardia sp. Ae331_Ps2]OLM02688.1 hypothetical protein Ae406Ps2_2688c [Pseudonocardia sp. Ae406_Ps2]OLM12476.1 hypothetical protein Ae505Ps2_2604 [Pseudonocardia sp. Ae505_Ps2]OLM24265.1 hypothetical protein Ae706Ps2_2698c [Pseudonocardia sp. Ae706_Ps2]